MPQISTTGALENASREMISTARYTEEHNAPCMELVEKFTLQKGSDTLILPKVGQMTISGISEGQDIVDEEEIGMSTISVTTSEVGAKIIVTDRLLRQNTQAIWAIVGRQMGDAMARKKDGDIIDLFSGFSAGHGAVTKTFSAANATSAIGIAKTDKYGSELRIVVHPNQMMALNKEVSTLGVATANRRPIPAGISAERMDKFWTGLTLGGVPFFEDGNIARTTDDDAVGALFDKGALGVLTSVGMNKEKQRDASLRASELVITADYAAFEIDDSRGASLTYDAADPSTDA